MSVNVRILLVRCSETTGQRRPHIGVLENANKAPLFYTYNINLNQPSKLRFGILRLADYCFAGSNGRVNRLSEKNFFSCV